MESSNGKEKTLGKERNLSMITQRNERKELLQRLEEEAKHGIALSCFDAGSLLLFGMEEDDLPHALEFWRKGYEYKKEEQKSVTKEMSDESITCFIPCLTVDLSSLFIEKRRSKKYFK